MNGNKALLNINNDILNIKQWGAKADVATATDKILNNTVFTNILSYHNISDKLRIYIPIGTFWISQTINITTNVTEMFGAGREKSIIRMSTDGIDIIAIQQAGNSSVYHDFGIYSQWNITNYAFHCYNRGGARLRIENLRIQDCRKGIILEDGYNDCVIIRNVKFHLVGDCMAIKQNDNGIIEDCNAEPFTNSFLELFQANACAVRNCLVNTSNSIFSAEGSNSTAFILSGNYNSDSTQHYGCGITIENIHSEYVKTFALIGIPYVTLKDIYVWNGNLENDHYLFHLANIGNNPLHNIQMYNIIADDCPYAEGKYHLCKRDYSETSVTAGNGKTYNTPVNNVTNLYVNGFEGDAYIPTKLSDAHSATYYIRDKNVAYSNGSLVLFGTGAPTMTTAPLTLRAGSNALQAGDRFRTPNNNGEFIYALSDQKWYGIKPMFTSTQGQTITYTPKTYNGMVIIAIAATQHNRQVFIQAIIVDGVIAQHTELTNNATLALSEDNKSFKITYASYMNPVSIHETCYGFYRT